MAMDYDNYAKWNNLFIVQCFGYTQIYSVPEEDHSHSRNGGRGGTAQVMGLKQEVHIRSKLDSLSGWHGKEPVVIQYRIQGLDPLWINVTITNNPRLDLYLEITRLFVFS